MNTVTRGCLLASRSHWWSQQAGRALRQGELITWWGTGGATATRLLDLCIWLSSLFCVLKQHKLIYYYYCGFVGQELLSNAKSRKLIAFYWQFPYLPTKHGFFLLYSCYYIFFPTFTKCLRPSFHFRIPKPTKIRKNS